MRFAYDRDANALAISLRDGAVAQTVEFDSGTLVDLDENDEILTIEVINPGRRWPLDEIAADYPISDDDLRVLRKMFAGSGRSYAFTQPVAFTSDNRDVELVGV